MPSTLALLAQVTTPATGGSAITLTPPGSEVDRQALGTLAFLVVVAIILIGAVVLYLRHRGTGGSR